MDIDALHAAVQLSRTRDHDRDLAFAIGHLADVAVHALTGSSKDTATSHEAMVQLGAVLERVIERGAAPEHRADAEGRRLFDDAAWRPCDHVELVSRRLRTPASHEPEAILHFVDMLGKARAAASDAGDRASIEEVSRQLDTVLTLAERRELPPPDRRALGRAAETAMDGKAYR